MRTATVRFFWRYSYSTGPVKWSQRQAMPLAKFALYAEAEVA